MANRCLSNAAHAAVSDRVGGAARAVLDPVAAKQARCFHPALQAPDSCFCWRSTSISSNLCDAFELLEPDGEPLPVRLVALGSASGSDPDPVIVECSVVEFGNAVGDDQLPWPWA
jgi:hypothetical protein